MSALFWTLVVLLMLWLLFRCTGLVLRILFVLCFQLPAAALIFSIGLGLCATIIGIPFGLMCFRLAGQILVKI